MPSVYFLLSHDERMVKIGKSMKPRKRIHSIRTMNPHMLSVLLVIPGYTHTETWLHSVFSGLRSHGEWFWYEGMLVEVVELLKSGKRTLRDLNPHVVLHDEHDLAALSNTK